MVHFGVSPRRLADRTCDNVAGNIMVCELQNNEFSQNCYSINQDTMYYNDHRYCWSSLSRLACHMPFDWHTNVLGKLHVCWIFNMRVGRTCNNLNAVRISMDFIRENVFGSWNDERWTCNCLAMSNVKSCFLNSTHCFWVFHGVLTFQNADTITQHWMFACFKPT